ncbi:TonB-dependent receptor domain-containing protein [Marinifilum fragile]|uniref:TonB-dependent receptor domain-containing protein n=1 Tax=Marinifilum fragile TaxID=570161 RepID=UPI002AA63379|nr:TonB-dependent receptor [Marinifilum fragile]
MKYKILLIFFLLLLQNIQAQNCKITGKIIDEQNSIPLPYANAILTSLSDSTILLGAISNDNGVFEIEKIKRGKYNLMVSFIGYQSVEFKDVNVYKGTRNIGDIKLKVLSENLNEITVKAVKSPVSYKVDRKVINASSFPEASVALDLLENVPSLEVGFEGELTYRGDGTFKVFINGHPVKNGLEKMQQLDASKIDKIEVITNPSAKYDAEGTAGIIQIILKKNRLEGYAITTSAQFSTNETKRFSLSIDKQSEKGGWYINGNASKQYWSDVEIDGSKINNYGDQQFLVDYREDRKQSGTNGYVEFGFNYDVTDKDCIDFNLNVNPLLLGNDHEARGHFVEQTLQDGNEIKYEEYDLKNRNKSDYQYLGATFEYEHSFTKNRDHLLSFYADYSTYLHKYIGEAIDTKTYADRVERIGTNDTESNETFVSLKLCYANKLSENSSFEIGGQVDTDHIPKMTVENGTYDSNDMLIPFPNDPIDQEVVYKRDIYAGFVTFKSKIGKFEYKLGTRVEWTDRQLDYEYTNQEGERIKQPSNKDFWDLFPSAHFLYNFTDEHQIGVSYSRRIKRPNYWPLAPFRTYEDSYSYVEGNENLMPSYSNSFELNYKKSWNKDFIGVELFAHESSDVIQNYYRLESENVSISSKGNIGNSLSLGCEFMAGVDLFSWWNINLSTSMYHYRLNVDYENQNSREEQFKVDSRLNNIITLPENFTFKWDVKYKSPHVSAQSEREAYIFSNMALKKSIKDDQWQILLSVNNVFNSIKYKNTTQGDNFIFEDHYRNKPSVMLKLTYNFDNQK